LNCSWKTFDIFASYWPQHENEWPGINRAAKYVVSNTLKKHTWENSVFLSGDIVEQINKLKQKTGPDIQTYGSGNLIQTLMKNDLVDEFWLKIFPVTLGTGNACLKKALYRPPSPLSDPKPHHPE
jgi:dihydrofolate reductase